MRLYSLLSLRSWTFYHVVFWVITIISLAIDSIEYAKYDPAGYVMNIFLRNGLLMVLVYFNLYYLIPKYYQAGKKYIYWSALLITTCLFVFIYNNFLFERIPLFLRGEIEKESFFLGASNFFLACRYLFISVLFRFIQNWFNQEKKLSEFQIEKLRAQSNYLRAQVNPHFLFNTLNNLYGLALKKSDKTAGVILRLSNIMDYMLYENEQNEVPLKNDIDNLRNYIEIERIRQGNNARINFTVNGVMNDQKIVPLLFLPLIENAFKHGVNKEIDHAFLDATLLIKNNTVELTVVNNKTAGHEAHPARSGIGLTNLKKRLALFYTGRHELIIKEDDGLFSVSLKIELK